MSEALRAIRLTDEFHKLKRAILLFCSAVLLVRIAAIDGVSYNGMSMKFPENILPFLLWTGAAYYILGFAGEFRIILHHNNRSAGLGQRKMEGVFEALQAKAGDILKELSEGPQASVLHLDEIVAGVELPNLTATAKKAVKDGIEEAARLEQNRQAPQFGTPSQESSDLSRNLNIEVVFNKTWGELKQFPHDETHPIVKQLANSRALQERRNAALERLNDFPGEIQAERKELKRFLSSGRRDEHIYFWGWDVGGVAGAFILATVAMWWPAPIVAATHFMSSRLPTAPVIKPPAAAPLSARPPSTPASVPAGFPRSK